MATSVLSYNAENVAVLAQTTFEVSSGADGSFSVAVPRTEWSVAASATSRPYVAFATAGTKLQATNPQLGSVDIDENTETCVLKFESAKASADGKTIVFTGTPLDVRQIPDVYAADGDVVGVVSDEEKKEALKAVSFDSDAAVEANVVDMPTLDADTARAWASALSGSLEMLVFELADGQGVSADGDYEKVAVPFDLGKYKGYYEEYQPLSDPDGEGYKDFSAEEFRDAWMVDGAGYLWHVGAAGEQSFYGTSFYTLSENALNNSSSTGLSAQDGRVAAALAETLAGVHFEPNIALHFGGGAATAYLTVDIDNFAFSPTDMTLSFTCVKRLRLSISYGMARDTKLNISKCINPKGPLSLQAGPISANVYFSLGIEFDAFRFSVAFEVKQSEKTFVDLTGGGSWTQSLADAEGKASLCGGFGIAVKAFVTCDFMLGKKLGLLKAGLSLASVDAGAAVELKTEPDVLHPTCATLLCDAYAFLRAPSTYDRQPDEVADIKEPDIHSVLKRYVKEAEFYTESESATLASCHVENGVRVPRCTKEKELVASMVSDIGSVTYTGRAQKPKIAVQGKSGALVAGVDYKVTYSNNVNAGSALATVAGVGNYTGVVEKRFAILKADMSKVRVSAVKDKNYNGSAKRPSPDVCLGTKKLVRGTDYKLSYTNNVNIGTATIKLKGKGNFTGETRALFKIVAKFPEWKGGSSQNTTKTSTKIPVTLKEDSLVPITRIRVSWGKSPESVNKWTTSKGKTRGVRLKKKGDVDYITITGLKANTKYYYATCLGFQCGGKWYYAKHVPKNPFKTLAPAANASSDNEEQEFSELNVFEGVDSSEATFFEEEAEEEGEES